MNYLLFITLVGTLAASPVQAEPESPGSIPSLGLDDCTNNGIVVQAAVGTNAVNCEGECTNNGVVVQAGTANTYTCGGECTNNGVYVWGPRLGGQGTGCGTSKPSLAGACAGDACATVPHPCDPRVCDISIIERNQQSMGQGFANSWKIMAGPTPPGIGVPGVCEVSVKSGTMFDPQVHCGRGSDCSVSQNAGCWAVRRVSIGPGCALAVLNLIAGYLQDSYWMVRV